jgi:hypothetical protein
MIILRFFALVLIYVYVATEDKNYCWENTKRVSFFAFKFHC